MDNLNILKKILQITYKHHQDWEKWACPCYRKTSGL